MVKRKNRIRAVGLMLAVIMIISIVPDIGAISVKASGYDANNAVLYARAHSCNHVDGGICGCNYNTEYHNYNGPNAGDCANFVSQCLAAGGLPVNQSWGVYRQNGEILGNEAWINAPALLNYFKNDSRYSGLVRMSPSKSEIVAGNPVWTTSEHVMICSEVSGGVTKCCGHNNDRKDYAVFSYYATVRLDLLGSSSVNVNTNSSSDNPGSPYPIPSRNIARGASGDDVKWVQKFANDVMGAGISVDGVSGNQTVYAVQQFQSQQGLTVDGIVGTQTINRMLEVWREYVKPKDTTPPTISNARVTSITTNSITIVANITDSSGVKKVQFPTWPAYKTSDGCTWYNPTSISGSQYTFVIPISDFGYYAGKYNTHIYAWDNYDNYVCVPLNNIGPLKMNPYSTAVRTRKKFEVYNYAVTFDDAKKIAESKGGRLLYIKDISDITRLCAVFSRNALNFKTKAAYWLDHAYGKNDFSSNGNEHVALLGGNELAYGYYPVDYYASSNGNIGFIVEYDYECSHNWVLQERQNPTCTSGGTERYRCSLCSDNDWIVQLDALGHSWDGGKVSKAATCTAEGTKTFTCTRCGTTKKETIKAKGHKAVTDKAVAATCTKDGKTEGSHCSVCGVVIKKQSTVKAKGHSWDVGKVTKAATATTDGVKTYTCKTCNATKKETIKATGVKGTTKYNGVDYSKVYDYNYYINKYADLKKAFGNDDKAAIKHFVTHGMKEGRQAKSSFDVYSYKNRYQDLRLAFGNDLPKYYMHFINHGSKEGRKATGVKTVQNPVTKLNGVDYSKVYDYNYYINKYADIKKTFGNDDIATLRHFINYGMKEGRQAKSSFDVKSYRRANQDLRTIYGYNWKQYYDHYMRYGYREGRKATGVTSIQKPVTKYNGVDYSKVYDYNYYIKKYADIKKAFGDDDVAVLRHFVNYGMRECRQAKESFDVKAYKNRYADLRRVYGNDFKAYYLHYIKWGYKEGRDGRFNKSEELYRRLLNELYDAYKDYSYGNDDKIEKLILDTDGALEWNYFGEFKNMYYTFKDIDKDGIEELFLAQKLDSNNGIEYRLKAVYTVDGGRYKTIICSYGKNYFYFLNDNTFFYSDRAGHQSRVYVHFKYNSKEKNVYVIDGFLFDASKSSGKDASDAEKEDICWSYFYDTDNIYHGSSTTSKKALTFLNDMSKTAELSFKYSLYDYK